MFRHPLPVPPVFCYQRYQWMHCRNNYFLNKLIPQTQSKYNQRY